MNEENYQIIFDFSIMSSFFLRIKRIMYSENIERNKNPKNQILNRICHEVITANETENGNLIVIIKNTKGT